jgi:short-subunit dehydrogenase
MRRRTENTNAVVTGAGSGIGRAFALELARRGGRVVCADIDIATARQTVHTIEAAGGRALAIACDVAHEPAVREVADAAEGWFEQPVDLVINNAGIGNGGRVVGELSLEDWRYTLGVNLWGVVHGCHVFTPKLRAHGRGGIINVASAASFAAAPHMAPYNVSKAAVLSLSETLAAELSGSGVVVTVLCPTFVKTNIVTNGRMTERSARLGTLAMRWAGVPAERIARVTLDAHDRGELHVVPQLDAKLIWMVKRLAPRVYTRAAGWIGRFA